MAEYNVSKSEAKRLGIERYKIPSGDERGGLSKSEYVKQRGTTPAVSSPSDVKSLDDAKSFINAGQSAEDVPDIRSSIKRLTEGAGELTKELTGGLERPELPQYEETYGELRGEYGIDELEQRVADFDVEADEILATLEQAKIEQKKKGVVGSVVEGRIEEQEQQAKDRLDFIQRQRDSYISELNTKNNTISMLMNFRQMDYTAAKDQYNTEFSQSLQALNAVQGIEQNIKDEQQRIVDNAKANLSVIYNNIADSTEGYAGLSSSQKSQIVKLEAQAGLPSGFFKTIQSKNPGGRVVTTTEFTDSSGKRWANTILKQADGSTKVEKTYLGQGKVPSSGDSGLSKSDAKGFMSTELNRVAGSDGHVHPNDWNKARRSWTASTNYSVSDFDKEFQSYVNPNHYWEYDGFEKINDRKLFR